MADLTERDKRELYEAQVRVSPLTPRIEAAVSAIVDRHVDEALAVVVRA